MLRQSCASIRFSFFFQAEDGIRDRNVTGVQTCALPIYRHCGLCDPHQPEGDPMIDEQMAVFIGSGLRLAVPIIFAATGERSEERRVGKEGRPGWSTDAATKQLSRRCALRTIDRLVGE